METITRQITDFIQEGSPESISNRRQQLARINNNPFEKGKQARNSYSK